MTKATLLDHFSALEDPRQAWKVLYPLPEILLIVLCGTMAGAEDFCEIERWAREKLDFLRRLLSFAKGVPSHDALKDVMNALPSKLFAECFTNWVESLREREPDIVRSTARPRGARMAGTGRRCIWCPPGPPASASCSASKPELAPLVWTAPRGN